MNPSDYAWMSAVELIEALRSRQLSPVELVEAAIARIEEQNPAINAVVHLGADDARAAARAAEHSLADGTAGPLTGVPVLMKDLFDFKPGWPSTLGGVRALAGNIAQHSCLFVERMESAGAIVLGKTNSPVFGARGITDNPLFGPTRNPFDVTRNPGGSSGGAAAAVAAGFVPIAEGTDAGGSIRIPAAWTSTYGFKPSAGRVPSIVRPLGFLNSAPFITEGPITRTVADAALAMSTLAGPDPRAPHCLDGNLDYGAALERSVAGRRVGYSPELGAFTVEAEVARAVDHAVTGFEECGAHVELVELSLPADHAELAALWHRSMMQISLASLEAMQAQGIDLLTDLAAHFPPSLTEQIEQARSMSARQLRNDDALRTEVYDALTPAVNAFDLLVSPTVGALPVLNADDGDTIGPSQINGQAVDPLIGWTLTFPLNFTGNPAASIPAGLVNGLPLGMQLIGRQMRDLDVLTFSAAYERARPWAADYRLTEND